METKIHFTTLENSYFSFNAIVFVPRDTHDSHLIACFTHGYTACKNDNFNWARRLSDAGVPTIIFDLPGHYLGGLHEVDSFDRFKSHAHECFTTAYEKLSNFLNFSPKKVVIGGHSLGALLALKALTRPRLENALAVCVGLGISQHKSTHLFETSFYQKTLNIRRQLVSKELDSSNVFPWIQQEKTGIEISSKRIHLITGEDDVVVGPGGLQALYERLSKYNNEVTLSSPKKLPHHEPAGAASYLFHFLKKEFKL